MRPNYTSAPCKTPSTAFPAPRFISTLEGQANFSLNTLEGRLKGAFDRQALALAFKYQRDAQPRPHLDAGIALQKLNLTPYLEDLKPSHH